MNSGANPIAKDLDSMRRQLLTLELSIYHKKEKRELQEIVKSIQDKLQKLSFMNE